MSELGPQLPQWWNDHIEAAWCRSRAAALGDWSRGGDRSLAVDATTLEHALAFGHGARSAYSSSRTWDAVSPQLRADWIRLGHVGPASWDRVASIIRHEWLRAGGPDGDAAPEMSPEL